MNQTLNILCIHNNLILTSNFRFLLGDPDKDTVIDTQTGEVLTVEGCTTDVNGRLESLSVS